MANTGGSSGMSAGVTDMQNAITISYISSSTDNGTQLSPILPPIISTTYYDDSGSWMFSSRDIPILIGAAAGAIGLILIFLAAALIWHCCQFALQREKSSYSLENESEKNSVGSRGSNFYINNPIDSTLISDEKSAIRDHSDQNLKRSMSAPIDRDSNVLKSNTQTPVCVKPNDKTTRERLIACDNSYAVDIEDSDHHKDSISIGMELNDQNDTNPHRSHVYITNHGINADFNSLKSKSLPWSQSNKRRTVTIDDETEELAAKIKFTKKRKNRMANDSAAAIAMNRSGSDANPKTMYSHKDTDTLVDNEAIVVYDERTAL